MPHRRAGIGEVFAWCLMPDGWRMENGDKRLMQKSSWSESRGSSWRRNTQEGSYIYQQQKKREELLAWVGAKTEGPAAARQIDVAAEEDPGRAEPRGAADEGLADAFLGCSNISWWHGRYGSGRRYWSSGWDAGWDETAWPSAGWQEPSWQDDGREDPPQDLGHDFDAPERHFWENCRDQQDAKAADVVLLEPGDPAAEPADQRVEARPAEEDQDVLRRLHAEALRRFRLDEPELGSDDEAPASARIPMLVDDGIDADIAEFDCATGGVTCKICKLSLNSKSQWADHQKGRKHFKKVSAEERRRGANVQKLDKANDNVPAVSYQ